MHHWRFCFHSANPRTGSTTGRERSLDRLHPSAELGDLRLLLLDKGLLLFRRFEQLQVFAVQCLDRRQRNSAVVHGRDVCVIAAQPKGRIKILRHRPDVPDGILLALVPPFRHGYAAADLLILDGIPAAISVRGIAPALSVGERIHGEVGRLARTLWFRSCDSAHLS